MRERGGVGKRERERERERESSSSSSSSSSSNNQPSSDSNQGPGYSHDSDLSHRPTRVTGPQRSKDLCSCLHNTYRQPVHVPATFTLPINRLTRVAELEVGWPRDSVQTVAAVYVMWLTIIIIIIVSKALFEIFYNLLTAPRPVSNTYAQVARAQSCAKSCATHRALIMCNMSCYVPLGTKGQLNY